MPKPPMPAETFELFRKPNPAVIAVQTPEGQPVSVATWYLVEDDGRVLVNMDGERARVAWMRAEPRVALTALKDGEWYTHVSIRGRVVEWRDDVGLVDIDRLSTHYGGKPYPTRDRPRVSALIEVEHWHGWGAAKAKG
jgi:PPOX class probable F420-dependent enzyme